MFRPACLLLLCLGAQANVAIPGLHEQTSQPDAAVLTILSDHQFDLAGDGLSLLLAEAKSNDFFLLGELHGDNEIPELLHALWPRMMKVGYRHIAAEISPWAAHQLEDIPAGRGPEVWGLWTSEQASSVNAAGAHITNLLWGCDMEEIQPQHLIRELANLNPSDSSLKKMVELTKDGYHKESAPLLLTLARNSKGRQDEVLDGISLHQNLLATLQIEQSRFNKDAKMLAQNERELLMKQQFLAHLRYSSTSEAASKVLFRFGRNHLHRGYDARGISTLGNFVAEYAITHGQNVFNVEADERNDELAFALLAQRAKYSATVYDLRPLRQVLYNVPQEKRSALQSNLLYWADSYDALICYKIVTPLKP